jgi:DNA-binding transcriptional LysR family regulator
MDFRDLGYFETIATMGHLGRAAERLGRSQPALSKCIDRLEDEIGAQLFEHIGRGLRLTRMGEVLLDQAKTMRRAMDDTIRQLAAHAEGAVGDVRIGISPAVTQSIAPATLQRLFRETEKVTVSIVSEGSQRLRAILREQQVDLVIGQTAEYEEEEFVTEPLWQDRMIVAARPGHPLAGKYCAIGDVAPWKWLLPLETVRSRQWLNRMFESNALGPPDIQVESNMVLQFMRLVERTDLLTFIARGDLGPGQAAEFLCEIDVPELTLVRNLGVVHLRHAYLSPLAKRFMGILREHAADIPVE